MSDPNHEPVDADSSRQPVPLVERDRTPFDLFVTEWSLPPVDEPVATATGSVDPASFYTAYLGVE